MQSKIIKILTLILAVNLAGIHNAQASEPFGMGVWFGYPDQIENKTIEGIAFGLPVIDNYKSQGASLSFFGSKVEKMEGLQITLLGFNYARSLAGIQLSLLNIFSRQYGGCGAQLGLFNHAGENGFQLGIINNASNNATVQLGLINLNKGGLFPVMLFVNFSRDFFK